MIDAHCHIDLYPKPAEVIAEAVKRGTYILAVTTTPRAFDGNKLFIENTKRIKIAIGLHPELVAERHKEVGLLIEKMEKTRYVGEIGLDGSPDHQKSFSMQRDVFVKILNACRDQGGKIISMHSRRAVTPLLDEIQSIGNIGIPILHWFSGSKNELLRAIELGCWFSVGPAMLVSARGRQIAALIPKNRMLLETDGPFGQKEGRSLLPWESELAIPILAKILGESTEEIKEIVFKNFISIIS